MKTNFGIYGNIQDASEKTKRLLAEPLPKEYKLKYPKKPYPSDEQTLQELQELISYVGTERVANKEFIDKADKDLVLCFKDLLGDLGIDYGEVKSGIQEIVEKSSILIIKIKYLYNRPRPYQVAKIKDINFQALGSESAKTPSYPSGHTIQSLLIAQYLSKIYPQYMDKFYALANKISYSRMWGGFHFYSDIQYGKEIFKVIKMKSNKLNSRSKVDYGKKSNAKKAMENLPESTQKALKTKGKEHNEEFGDNPKKKLPNINYLAVSYHRGVGAYHTNPSSVRPNVSSPEQWAMGRVNGLLYALKNGKFKRKPFDTDLLPKEHPEYKQDRAVGDKDPTNFPKRGDDKKVSLRNSEYPLFPLAYAKKLKEEHPEIWKLGGNIRGNDQYSILTKIQNENNGVPKTESQEAAIRRREAWMARHLKDFRIAGVIAQIKWLGIGSRGLSYMKNLINEEIKKRKDKGRTMKKDLLKCLSTKNLDNGNKEYKLNGKARAWFALDKMQVKEISEDSEDKSYSIFGIASSTSIDSYGTEMSIEALRSMSMQFNRGIPVLPRHSSILSTGIAEWDEVIGRTMEAEIKRTEVVNPAEDREVQYSLFVRSELYADDPKSKDLIKRINRGEPIGQSIGGWFENVRVIENESGEIQRVLVDDVVLDHVAITRAPANPDSVNLMMMSIRTSIDNFNKNNIEYVRTKSIEDIEMDITNENRDYGHLDTEEEKKHEEGAIKDDQDHIEYLEIDEAEDESDSRMMGEDRMKEDMEDEDRMKEEMERLKEENERMKKELAALKEKAELKEKAKLKEKAEMDEDSEEDTEEDLSDEEKEKDLVPDSEKKLGGTEKRDAVPFQDLPRAPIDMKWSFSAEDGDEILGVNKDWSKYKRAHLYYDKENPENKSGYKLPIAKIYNGKLSVFFRAIVAAMASLNGARGGIDIPEMDKKSVYKSIQKYYEKFGETAPALKIQNSNIQNITQNMDEEFDNSVQSLKNNDNDDKDTISNSMETPMTENDLQKLAEMITNSVRTALEPKQEKIQTRAVSEETEFDKLKARLERTENMLNAYLEEPVRSGIHQATTNVRAGIGAQNEFTKLITRAKQDSVIALTGVMERNVSEISEENGPSKLTSTQVRDLLIKGLRAAQVDGLI